MIINKTSVFDMVEHLSAQRPFKLENIEKITGKQLDFIKDRSNDYFMFYESSKSSDKNNDNFTIELRIPTSKSSRADGILILDLSTETFITHDDVVSKYGLGEPSPPDPNEPDETALMYLVYDYDWGKISYGFDVINMEFLRSIVLNANRKKP